MPREDDTPVDRIVVSVSDSIAKIKVTVTRTGKDSRISNATKEQVRRACSEIANYGLAGQQMYFPL